MHHLTPSSLMKNPLFILPLILTLALLLATPTPALEPLTDAEKQRLTATELAAKKTPEMREAAATFNAVRKAYQLDRQKFPADRDPALSATYRKALARYEAAKRKAMLQLDPALSPLLQQQAELARRGMSKANEGETVADSDSSKNAAIRPIADVPGLPRVLLIGDSISIGYTLQVRDKLKGKANVHRIPMNGGATEVGLEKMTSWLGDQNWDVIHFNFGLHDAKYASATTQRATREQYARNLRTLVAQMKATGATLIFATTTPVPMGGVLSPTRKFDSIPERNQTAAQVMRETGVAINDVYAVMLPVQDKVGRPNDVHYQPEGYEVLAKAVAASIEAALATR
jgi:lysophospholipase L1-like esterase